MYVARKGGLDRIFMYVYIYIYIYRYLACLGSRYVGR